MLHLYDFMRVTGSRKTFTFITVIKINLCFELIHLL